MVMIQKGVGTCVLMHARTNIGGLADLYAILVFFGNRVEPNATDKIQTRNMFISVKIRIIHSR
jgi:hypothetical protein